MNSVVLGSLIIFNGLIYLHVLKAILFFSEV